jgi:hypothetical protein
VIAELVAWSEGAEIDLVGVRDAAANAAAYAYAYAAYAYAAYAYADAANVYADEARTGSLRTMAAIVRTHVDVALVERGLR